ncbi:hypothetical protein EDB98_12462 [Pseudomonas fluorescens]|nr:hypothetical protein EDB98_12462 [Pseudomonas fluorescens]
MTMACKKSHGFYKAYTSKTNYQMFLLFGDNSFL